MTVALRQRPLTQVVNSIVKAGNGCWLDPSDMSTMFQDAAGTTPVTAVEQPVGLVLDKSQGLMLGPEEVPVDYLSNTSLWTVTNGTSQATEGKITFTASGGGTLLVIIYGSSSGFKQGKYRITGISPAITVDRYFMGRAIGNTATVGDQTCVGYQWKAELFGFVVHSPPVGATFSIEQLSVRELYGNHATQSITASRPTLSARYNLLTKTEDFSDAAWGRVGVTVSGRTISFSASNTSRVLYAITGGGNFTISCRFSEADAGKIIRFGFWASGLDGLGNGNSLDIVIPQNGFVSFSKSNVVSLTNVGLINASSGVAQSVTLMNGFGISLTTGTTSGQYQRVNTAMDYDTDERYFPKYLRFDGIDDYLNLPYMGLYAGGAATSIMARDMIINPTQMNFIIEASTASTSPIYYQDFQMLNTLYEGVYIENDAGTAVVLNAPDTGEVVTGAMIKTMVVGSSSVKKYRNGVPVGNISYTRSGTLTLNTTTLGATSGPTLNSFAKMNLYGLIITKSALTDAQRVRCERYAASKAGVIL